ncbi:MAG: hypothetical protein L6R39_003476 [Caloplaca ligustica]|nr:MAG: hypothetical protein L6R39_003476 [Caloplaca ligustica]
MNNHQSPHDMYYDQSSSRSPGAHRHQQQTLHRQPSRQFDPYAMPNNMYQPEDPTPRFDANRFDRMNPAMQGGGYGAYDMPSAQTWNPSAFSGANGFPTFGATGRMKPMPRGRSALPPVSHYLSEFAKTRLTRPPKTWLDQQQMHNGGAYGGLGPSPLGMSQLRPDQFGEQQDEELIPTAIVIKNIPFAVKKEQLVDLMTQMNLPLPYAFNYHFDNGVFRGLAFANFTSADETATVIDHLNHFELQGRKLRVEYKKMLPLQERERIEREKRERRGQLEEQHRPFQLHTQPSMSSMSSHVPTSSPSPLSARNEKPGGPSTPTCMELSTDSNCQDVDLNDPQTLSFYSQLLLFKDDMTREVLIFPAELSPIARRIVHTLAHHMGLCHASHNTGDQRQVHVYRSPGHNISPPLPQGSSIHSDSDRRNLSRATTMEFNEARGVAPGMYNVLRGQQSTGFLGIPDSPGGFGNQSNLRGAKSFADLRSYSPSPVPSSASFPAALQSNIARFQEQQANNYGPGSAASTTPTLTPTASAQALNQHRSEDMLVNGFGGMSLGSSTLGPNGGSPRRLRGMFSWDQDSQASTAGPIGSNRSFSNNYDSQSRERGPNLPVRQPHGPAVERGAGFSRGRQNGHQARGSDELRQNSNVEIIVE